MCREILNTCVRNTEVAEKSSQARGTRKAMWGMIEESELAKSIRQKEEKKVGWPLNVLRMVLILFL